MAGLKWFLSGFKHPPDHLDINTGSRSLSLSSVRGGWQELLRLPILPVGGRESLSEPFLPKLVTDDDRWWQEAAGSSHVPESPAGAPQTWRVLPPPGPLPSQTRCTDPALGPAHPVFRSRGPGKSERRVALRQSADHRRLPEPRRGPPALMGVVENTRNSARPDVQLERAQEKVIAGPAGNQGKVLEF